MKLASVMARSSVANDLVACFATIIDRQRSSVLDMMVTCSAVPLRAEVGNRRHVAAMRVRSRATRPRFLQFGVPKSVSIHDKWFVSIF